MFSQWNSFKDHSSPYITGNSFAAMCAHVWNYNGYKKNRKSRNKNWVFIKTDYISSFFSKVRLNKPFVVFTHNSDFPINESHIKYIEDSRVLVWFAQNVAFHHPKLKPIPIGIANFGYAHGDISVLNKKRSENNVKETLLYANFNVGNNRAEREYCLQQTGVQMRDCVNGGWDGFAGGYKVPTTFEGYLGDLSRSYFCLSPQGNGIDCHRTWEALYMGCIPIVTKSAIVEAHKDMPILILDDWAEFKTINFCKELYHDLWNNFDRENLHFDSYLRRIMNKIPPLH